MNAPSPRLVYPSSNKSVVLQRVLTGDLRWVSLDDLQLGDLLLGFDEFPVRIGAAGKRRRTFRAARVIGITREVSEIFQIVMEDGTQMRSAAGHSWLIATKSSRNQSWATCEDIFRSVSKEGRRRYMHKFSSVWETETSWDAGWLAGIMDGEGHVSVVGRRGVQFGVAQRPGLVLSEIERVMEKYNFCHSHKHVGTADVRSIQIKGGWRELFRLLGQFRPVRLLAKVEEAIKTNTFEKQMDGVGPPLLISAVNVEGEAWVTRIETETGTYLCEGFGALAARRLGLA